MSSKEELIAEAEKLGVDVDKRWGEKRLKSAIDEAKSGERVNLGPEFVETMAMPKSDSVDYMNSRVLAVWEGQSSSLPIHERKRRIIKAMEDKGFGDILEAIEWP